MRKFRKEHSIRYDVSDDKVNNGYKQTIISTQSTAYTYGLGVVGGAVVGGGVVGHPHLGPHLSFEDDASHDDGLSHGAPHQSSLDEEELDAPCQEITL